jgi:hypothetical protein
LQHRPGRTSPLFRVCCNGHTADMPNETHHYPAKYTTT